MRGGLLGATGVIHCCGESTLIYLRSHSNIVWCTWIPLQNHFPCSSLIGIIATPEIRTLSVQPEKTGVWEREREIFYLLCAYVTGTAATPGMCISSDKIPDDRDEKCFIEWCCQLQRLYSIGGKRNQIKAWSTGGMIPIWENWITQRKICSSAILSATIFTSTVLRSKHRPLQLENGD